MSRVPVPIAVLVLAGLLCGATRAAADGGCDPICTPGALCATDSQCPLGYQCADNGTGTRYCVGAVCTADAECQYGGICRQYCTKVGMSVACGPRRCQCPGFGCVGTDVICMLDGESLGCRMLCTQDSDCVDPFGFVCVNPSFGFGVCIGHTPCL
jgi:hypothetical protein